MITQRVVLDLVEFSHHTKSFTAHFCRITERDGQIIEVSKPHGIPLEPDVNAADYYRMLNEALDRTLMWPAIDADQWAAMEAYRAQVHTPAVIEAWREHKRAVEEQIAARHAAE